MEQINSNTERKIKLAQTRMALIKYISLGVGLSFFLLANFFPVFSAQTHDGIGQMQGFECIIHGSYAILGSANLEWLVWCANPLLLFGAIKLFRNDYEKANFAAWGALVLALIFLRFDSIQLSASGYEDSLVGLHMGYYFWLSSIVIFFLISNYFHFQQFRESQLHIQR